MAEMTPILSDMALTGFYGSLCGAVLAIGGVMTRTVSVIIMNQCSGASVMGMIDLFGIVNRISARINDNGAELFKLRVVSSDGAPVQCANGFRLEVDGSLDDIHPDDIVYISAFAIATREEVEQAVEYWHPLVAWLKSRGRQQFLISTSCSGTFVLAESGLLAGKQATTAWWMSKTFELRYPEISLDKDAICTVADNIICGAGTSSYQDVGLAIVEKIAGKHFARLTAKYMMVDNQRRSQAPYAILSLIDSDDKVVRKAESWIRANLNQDFRIEEVAEHVAVSPRTLIRRFQKGLGETPQSFTQKLRIEKCKVLLETTQLRFGEIMQRCGYNDDSAFRRLFKRHCQLSPRDYRRRFNTAVVIG